MSARPTANVYTVKDGKPVVTGTVAIPPVFSVRVRPDIVRDTCNKKTLSTRQAHGVKFEAGYETAAKSWGTGRAVARVPRVPGGGSHRSGQAAFANFCRGGGMFAPTKIWRRWTRKTNTTVKRHTQAFGFSAAGTTGLVMARGHRVENVPELPLVVTDDIENILKTKQLKDFLVGLGLGADIERCENNKSRRCGKGSMRNRKYKRSRGPLIVHTQINDLHRVCKNIEGVDMMKVHMPYVQLMCPGYSAGRMMVFTESAFKQLSDLYGNEEGIASKNGYKLPRCSLTCDSVDKVMQSAAVQNVIRPKMINPTSKFSSKHKPNPLKSAKVMLKLNPARDSMKAPLK